MYFISNTTDRFLTHAAAIRHALAQGCRLVQLRMKDASTDDRLKAIAEILHEVEAAGAKLIVDDDAEAVLRSGAHGLHIGKNDISIPEARRIIGPKILGATANTAADIIAAARAGADYVGLGPFRFTTTKKNLSPILGLEGVRAAIAEARAQGVDIPVYAIGGILPADIPALIEAGATDVALSGALLNM